MALSLEKDWKFAGGTGRQVLKFVSYCEVVKGSLSKIKGNIAKQMWLVLREQADVWACVCAFCVFRHDSAHLGAIFCITQCFSYMK